MYTDVHTLMQYTLVDHTGARRVEQHDKPKFIPWRPIGLRLGSTASSLLRSKCANASGGQ